MGPVEIESADVATDDRLAVGRMRRTPDGRVLLVYETRAEMRFGEMVGTTFRVSPVGSASSGTVSLRDFEVSDEGMLHILQTISIPRYRRFYSGRRPAGAHPCGGCEDSSDCVRGTRCVASGGSSTCFPLRSASTGSGCSGLAPYHELSTVRTTEGDSVEMCLPSTTCQAINGFGSECELCRGLSGAMCSAWGCTYECERDDECPLGRVCDTRVNACR